ncbi:MAG: Nramp family divalent metal transporter [candidate division NC10 bacterium]|nr:Nramp family divalent metal transporter [candidate division NC10 bacterium]
MAPNQRIFKVPDPFPLTLIGITAALGPMAINFGVSVGGGETMLIPYAASLGGYKLFWMMTLSTVFETFLVYECIKYTMLTGRSFFSMTRDIPPRGFWPWFWGFYAILSYVWPSWLAGSASAMYKLTSWGTFYGWCVAAFLLVIIVFAFSRYIYKAIAGIFTFVMIANLICVIIIAALVATPKDYLDVLWGYFNFGLAGYPKDFPLQIAFSLFQQPGGSLMFITFWVLEAGWGLGRHTGRMTGALRPPEEINTDPITFDVRDPSEMAKMKHWCKVAKWSLLLWWSVIGAMIGTYLYGVAGHAYLFKNGIVAKGLEVPLRMATIAGKFGPWASAIFLLFIFVTLYDAEFAIYDGFIGRTVSDAVATTPGLRGKRSYRFYYFWVVGISILAGFFLVRLAMPFTLWLITSFLALLARGIGAAQILYANQRWIPKEFQPPWYTKAVLWIGCVLGSAVACLIWALAQFKIIK